MRLPPAFTIFGWEFVQNVPIVYGLGLSIRARSLRNRFGLGIGGAIGSALLISLTERYKHRLERSPFRLREVCTNSIIFSAGCGLCVLYAPYANLRRDLGVGIGLGIVGGSAQWLMFEQSAHDGIRHTLAVALAGSFILFLVRWSSYVSRMKSMVLLLLAALIMTLIITSIDYWTNTTMTPLAT